MKKRSSVFVGMLAVLMAAPAFATTVVVSSPPPPAKSDPVPEPADFALFLLGVAGLVIGRRSSRAGRTRAE